MRPQICIDSNAIAIGPWCSQCDEQSTCATKIELDEMARKQRREYIEHLKKICKKG